MTFLLIFSGCIFLFYMVSILFATYKINNPVLKVSEKTDSNISYTIIVPFRDEIENLKHIYSDLLDLNFDEQRFEVIFIDDHSSDGSFEWLEKCDMPDNYKLLASSKMGKKQALIKAIIAATGSFIVTTDADCKLQPLWIKSIDETIGSKNPKLLIQPVITKFNSSLVNQFQYYDSLSLLGINMAVYQIQKFPSLASGANLIFQKEAFNKFEPFRDNVHIASGDDMFILKSFIKHDPNSITLNYTSENLVITRSENSWINLVNQRLRWAGKMKRFNNTTSFYLGMLSAIMQVVLIVLFILSVWHHKIYFFLFIWLVKSAVDYLFFRKTAKCIDQKVKWFNVFILEPVYMIFVPLIVFLSLFKSPKWKGRKINV